LHRGSLSLLAGTSNGMVESGDGIRQLNEGAYT